MTEVRIISGVMDHLMVRLVEWSTSAILFLFGFSLLQPSITFSNPSYSVLASLAPENAWGWFFFTVGGLRSAALVIDATASQFPSSLRVRAIGAGTSCFAWLSLAIGLYLGNPSSPGAKTYAALLVVDLITTIFLSRQADKHGRTLFESHV